MLKLECPFNHERLVDYASGNTELADRKIVERHLSQCAHCRREVMRLEETWWALDVWNEPVKNVPLRFDRLRAEIQKQKQTEPAWRRALDWMRRPFTGVNPAGSFASFFQMKTLVPATVMTAVFAALISLPMLQTDMADPHSQIIASATPTPVASGSNSLEPAAPEVHVASAESGMRTLDREERFNLALQKSQQMSKRSANRTLQAQTAGFTPNQNIWSSMEEGAQLQPSYVYGSVRANPKLQ